MNYNGHLKKINPPTIYIYLFLPDYATIYHIISVFLDHWMKTIMRLVLIILTVSGAIDAIINQIKGGRFCLKPAEKEVSQRRPKAKNKIVQFTYSITTMTAMIIKIKILYFILQKLLRILIVSA